MSPPHRRRLDVILSEGYLDDLAAKPIDAVRAMHEECIEVETEVSYVRRLAQARIDIVSAELERRAAGGSVEEFVAACRRSSPTRRLGPTRPTVASRSTSRRRWTSRGGEVSSTSSRTRRS
ncbi:MAG TPA: hypothetical protein VI462_18755 [Acidimicrobiia bacterium]